MDRTEIMNKLVGILQKSDYYFLRDTLKHLAEGDKITEDLSMDSIQIMEFIVDVEETFGLRFDFNEIDANNIETIGEIINLVQSYMSGDE